MDIFTTTLGQMGFLFLLILIGYILGKCRVVGEEATRVLGKLENTVFIPALVLATFIRSFTVEKLHTAWIAFAAGGAMALIGAVIAVFLVKPITKDRYVRNIFTYGLAFSNFSYVGNAVVSAIYPQFFLPYLIFTLAFWILIYLWGVPYLLLGDAETRHTWKENLKALVNPMIAAMLVGMVLGLTACPLPAFVTGAVEALGNCMSPVAMLITGITVAHISLKKTFTDGRIYAVTALRLVALPAFWLLIVWGLSRLFTMPAEVIVCMIAMSAMPLGLNTIVVPSAYGRDTTAAAGMALVSHILCCGTIPVVFMLMEKIFTL